MTEPLDHSGSDLRDFVRPIWRHRVVVAFVVAVTTVAAYVYNDRKPAQFRSTTQIFLQSSEVDQTLYGLGGIIANGERNLANQANLLRTSSVARGVAKRVKYKGNPDALLGALTVTPSSGSDFLVISTVSNTSAGAKELADAFARTFVDLRAQSTRNQIQRGLDSARRQLDNLPTTDSTDALRESLRTKISSLEAVQSLSPGGARQINEASAGIKFAPQPQRAAVFGFALSFVFALLIAYGLERLDRRVKHLDEISPAYHAPVLAALPHLRDGTVTRKGNVLEVAPAFREAVRGLRTNLRLASPNRPLQTFLVTSALPGEGKSTLVLNLALAYAEAGQRVAIIECDLRLPSLSKLIEVNPSPGLTDVLAGECELGAAVQRVDLGARVAVVAINRPREALEAVRSGSLTVLTAGAQPADPSSLLATQHMTRILASARENADVVIVDTPPLLSVSDALPLLGAVDATILVARVGRTPRSAARRVREIIERIPGASLLGVVANDVAETEFTGGYYSYGADYGPRQRPSVGRPLLNRSVGLSGRLVLSRGRRSARPPAGQLALALGLSVLAVAVAFTATERLADQSPLIAVGLGVLVVMPAWMVFSENYALTLAALLLYLGLAGRAAQAAARQRHRDARSRRPAVLDRWRRAGTDGGQGTSAAASAAGWLRARVRRDRARPDLQSGHRRHRPRARRHPPAPRVRAAVLLRLPRDARQRPAADVPPADVRDRGGERRRQPDPVQPHARSARVVGAGLRQAHQRHGRRLGPDLLRQRDAVASSCGRSASGRTPASVASSASSPSRPCWR